MPAHEHVVPRGSSKVELFGLPSTDPIPDELNPTLHISPIFDVKKTVYGGRGCFANRHISKGTKILETGPPIGGSVVRPFRKEVCAWCFDYQDGKTLKHRIDGKIYFCSSECIDSFSLCDPSHILRDALIAVEDLYLKCEGEIKESEVPDDGETLEDEIKSKWDNVHQWELSVSNLKPSKRMKFYPVVTTEDYAEIKYTISVIYSLYRQQNLDHRRLDLYTTSSVSESQEVELFKLLQSSEKEKVEKYPYLLISYINVYKFVRLVVPDCLLPYVTPNNIRGIIGRNLTNAFGIWSPITEEDEEREFFGFGVYASASYFNHSCDPNIQKTRVGNRYEFIASRDISNGEELCISYGVRKSDNVEERRKCLKEWFFLCGCCRCVQELANETNAN